MRAPPRTEVANLLVGVIFVLALASLATAAHFLIFTISNSVYGGVMGYFGYENARIFPEFRQSLVVWYLAINFLITIYALACGHFQVFRETGIRLSMKTKMASIAAYVGCWLTLVYISESIANPVMIRVATLFA
jgi:hypothetical protein